MTGPVAGSRSGAVDRSRDGRWQRSRRTVLAAATDLLEEAGVGGFSIDAVARRSGVARTTIYRHWPTCESLVLEACQGLDARYEAPDTGSLRGDLDAFAADIARMVVQAGWAAVLPSIIDAAERSDEFATMHSRIQRDHAAPVQLIVDRAVARGELPPGTDPAETAAAVLGPIFYRRWFSREPIDPSFLDAVVSRVTQRA